MRSALQLSDLRNHYMKKVRKKTVQHTHDQMGPGFCARSGRSTKRNEMDVYWGLKIQKGG
jgi:hypothetical protein